MGDCDCGNCDCDCGDCGCNCDCDFDFEECYCFFVYESLTDCGNSHDCGNSEMEDSIHKEHCIRVCICSVMLFVIAAILFIIGIILWTESNQISLYEPAECELFDIILTPNENCTDIKVSAYDIEGYYAPNCSDWNASETENIVSIVLDECVLRQSNFSDYIIDLNMSLSIDCWADDQCQDIVINEDYVGTGDGVHNEDSIILFCCGAFIILTCGLWIICFCIGKSIQIKEYSSVKQLNKSKDVLGEICATCFDGVADIVNVPCGHITYCNRCVVNDGAIQQCPECGETIVFRTQLNSLDRAVSTYDLL